MAKSVSKILSDARKFTQKGKFEKAIAEYELLLELDSEDPAPLNSIGDLYTKMGNLHRAVEYYHKAIDIYFEIGLFNNAIAVCKKILRSDPNKVEIYKTLANLYKEQSLTNDAIRHFVLYADKMREKQNVDEVLYSFKQVVELSPQNIDIRLRLTELYLNQDRKDDAIYELTIIAQSYDDRGDTEKAEETRQRIKEINPDADLSTPVRHRPDKTIASAPALIDEEIPVEEKDGILEFTPSAVSDDLKFGSDLTESEEDRDLSENKDLSIDMDVISDDVGGPPVMEITESIYSMDEEPVPEITESFNEPDDYADGMDEDSRDFPSLEFDPKSASIDELRYHLAQEPDDADARLELGRKLHTQSPEEAVDEYIEAGDHYIVMAKYNDSAKSYRFALELSPNNLHIHKKMLEIASRTGDISMMIHAYINFGDALSRLGEKNKAEFVYQKVLSIDEHNDIAQQRLEQLAVPQVEEEIHVSAPEEPARREAASQPVPEEAIESEGTVDLAALLSDDDEEEEPQSDKIRIVRKDIDTSMDLDDIISDFKAGVDQHIEKEDYASHYDLGFAYKDMGLIDEAIGEFQIATRGSKQRLKAFEMLGLCFLEKDELELALKQFQRGIATPGHEEFEYLGLHYNIGFVNERLQNWEEAKKAYEEVYVVDISFKDIAERISEVQKHLN